MGEDQTLHDANQGFSNTYELWEAVWVAVYIIRKISKSPYDFMIFLGFLDGENTWTGTKIE